jgi:hypothetical protein
MKSPLYSMALSAILAALCYVAMLPMLALYNVFLTLFICYSAGVLLGPGWGFITGIVGTFICSFFNPLGPALPPIMAAQMLGAGLAGIVGGATSRIVVGGKPSAGRYVVMGLLGMITAVLYHLLVDAVDAWLFGPFWVRLQLGLLSSLVTVVSNIVIFVVLLPALRLLKGALA